MSEACFDPRAAVGLWARMEKEEQGAPPQFLSTHPSSHNRMEKITAWLQEAEAKREESGCGMTGSYGTFSSLFAFQTGASLGRTSNRTWRLTIAIYVTAGQFRDTFNVRW